MVRSAPHAPPSPPLHHGGAGSGGSGGSGSGSGSGGGSGSGSGTGGGGSGGGGSGGGGTPGSSASVMVAYSPAERRAAIRRFQEKKKRALCPRIRYSVRKKLADVRPRKHGRFYKPAEAPAAAEAAVAVAAADGGGGGGDSDDAREGATRR